MNRLETVVTGIRPIKKLFVIRHDDVATLTEIIKVVSVEIAGLDNLILPSSISLDDKNLRRFVDMHDPDIILNYSPLPSASLQRCFLTQAFDAPSFDDVRAYASTGLEIWSNMAMPSVLAPTLAERDSAIKCVISGNADGVELFKALHYGIAPPDLSRSLQGSIFSRFTFVDPEPAPDLGAIHDHSLLYMSLGLSLRVEGFQSIYEPDANQEAWFEKKPTLVLGTYNDVASMCYFWNMRATYPFNDTLWLPVELAPALGPLLDRYRHVVIPTVALRTSPHVDALCRGRTVIDGKRHYFRLGAIAWESFRTTGVAAVIEDRIQVTHPSGHQFSDIGINMNVVYEVGGVREITAPRCWHAAALVGLRPDGNPLQFARLGARGLAIRERQFEFLRSDPLHVDLRLPHDLAVVREVMEERGAGVSTTPGTAAVQQLSRMLGGYQGAKLIASEMAIQILELLAPKRTSRLADEIAATGIQLGGMQLEQLARGLADVPALQQLSALTLAQLEGSLNVTKKRKSDFRHLVQKLYDHGVLLRGRSLVCPNCRTRLWYLLESISRPLVCYACGLSMEMPITGEDGGSDAFRLNELLVKAVDQGLIAVLLTMRVLAEQGFFVIRQLPSLEISCPEAHDNAIEIDIVVTLGRDHGLCEVKTGQAFDLAQCDRLLRTADVVDAAFVLLSTMKPRTDPTVAAIEVHLRAIAPKRPVMILTRESLLGDLIPNLADYYKRRYPLRDNGISVVGSKQVPDEG